MNSLRLLVPVLVLSFLSAALRAQTPTTGMIEGRVFDSGRAEYLERARLTVEGTTLETFSDESGQYRFTNVPVGTARVRVFFTGLVTQTVAVAVAAGEVAEHNITMAAGPSRGGVGAIRR